MSNEIQKLKPVERSLYRRVFMARIEGGQSPEAAHRHGLNAVKMWNEVGAFNEDQRPAVEPNSSLHRAADLYDALREYVSNPSIKPLDGVLLGSAVACFVDGDFDTPELRRRLGLDRDSSG